MINCIATVKNNNLPFKFVYNLNFYCFRSYNLCDAEPTLAHMSLTKLHSEGYVKHIVSQNCDGLHIRSGLPSHAISEVHGNMFTEVGRTE